MEEVAAEGGGVEGGGLLLALPLPLPLPLLEKSSALRACVGGSCRLAPPPPPPPLFHRGLLIEEKRGERGSLRGDRGC